MKKFFAIMSLVVMSSAFAQFDQFGMSYCQSSYRSDSFGRGIGQAFTGKDQGARYHDQYCFDLGVEEGKRVLALNEFWCQRNFERGYEEGMKVSHLGTGQQCFNMGYAAATADLGTGAREARADIVGLACVEAYVRGKKDSDDGRVVTRSGGESNKEHYCYSLGHYEGPVMP